MGDRGFLGRAIVGGRLGVVNVAEDYCESSARKAESVFGWNRQSVQLGLHEKRTDLICLDNFQSRGRRKTEEVLPNLEADIWSLVDGQCQYFPCLTVFYFCANP